MEKASVSGGSALYLCTEPMLPMKLKQILLVWTAVVVSFLSPCTSLYAKKPVIATQDLWRELRLVGGTYPTLSKDDTLLVGVFSYMMKNNDQEVPAGIPAELIEQMKQQHIAMFAGQLMKMAEKRSFLERLGWIPLLAFGASFVAAIVMSVCAYIFKSVSFFGYYKEIFGVTFLAGIVSAVQIILKAKRLYARAMAAYHAAQEELMQSQRRMQRQQEGYGGYRGYGHF